MRDLKSPAQPRAAMFLSTPTATRWMATSLLAIAAVVAVPGAHAQGFGGPGMGGPEGLGGPGPAMFLGPPDRINRTVDHLLDGLGATDAQRSQIKQIALAAAGDLRSQADRSRGLRERGVQAFAAPTVDANAAEVVRQELETQHDQASKRVLQAMLDVANVLTPEQRAKMAERLHQRQMVMQERMSREHRDRPAK